MVWLPGALLLLRLVHQGAARVGHHAHHAAVLRIGRRLQVRLKVLQRLIVVGEAKTKGQVILIISGQLK